MVMWSRDYTYSKKKQSLGEGQSNVIVIVSADDDHHMPAFIS